MSSAALKLELIDVVEKWPAAPLLALPRGANDNLSDPVAAASRAWKKSRQDLLIWRNHVIIMAGQWRKNMEDVSREGSDADLREHLAEFEALWPLIDRKVAEAAAAIAFQPEMREKLAFIESRGTASQRKSARLIAEKHRDVLIKRKELLEEMRDRLKAIWWDFDPDARGGEKFGDIDSLTAFLDS